MKKNIICISNHPNNLSVFFHIARMLRAWGLINKIFLIRIYHPYDEKLDIAFYLQPGVFTEIFDLPNVLYEKNLFRGWKNTRRFKRAMQHTLNKVFQVEEPFVALVADSAMLPVNALLKRLSHHKAVQRVVRLAAAPATKAFKSDWLRTVLANLYCLWAGGSAVRSVVYSGNFGHDFEYVRDNDVGFRRQVLSAWTYSLKPTPEGLPVVVPTQSAEHRDVVIFFGDATFFAYYGQDIGSLETYQSKVKQVFARLIAHYSDCEIWYRPHPGDNQKLMPEAEGLNFVVLPECTDPAELLMDRHHAQIRAVYSITSTSTLSGAFRGLPAYFLYPYFLKDSPFRNYMHEIVQRNPGTLAIVENLDDIGKKDALSLATINLEEMKTPWRGLLA